MGLGGRQCVSGCGAADEVSHDPAEWAKPEHLTAGAQLLADVLWDLANRA